MVTKVNEKAKPEKKPKAARGGTKAGGDPSRAGGPGTLAPGKIDYGSIDKYGRRSGIRATITKSMIGTGTHADQDIRPPGFGGQAEGHARGHLLGKQLGGSGDDEKNLVTLHHIPANTPAMRDFENAVRAAVEKGEDVDYRVTPIYDGTDPFPIGVTMSAKGDGSPPFELEVTILNRPKPD